MRVASASRFCKTAKTSSATVLHSSTISHRSRWYLTNLSGPNCVCRLCLGALTCSSANECSVFPSISAAWVFCEAKYTNSCPCIHPHISSKKPRSHLRVWLLPAPGTPCKKARSGSLRKGLSLPAGSDLSRPAKRPAALRWAVPECWGRASCAAIAQLPVHSACRTRTPPPAERALRSAAPAVHLLLRLRGLPWDLGPLRTVRGPPLAPHRHWCATAGLCCALRGPCGWSTGSRHPH